MIREVITGGSKRGLNPVEFLHWRNELRQDYQQAFDPPPRRSGARWPVATWLLVPGRLR